MDTRRVLTYVGIAFVIFYVLRQPANAASSVNGLMGQLGNAGTALGRFVNKLGH